MWFYCKYIVITKTTRIVRDWMGGFMWLNRMKKKANEEKSNFILYLFSATSNIFSINSSMILNFWVNISEYKRVFAILRAF